MKAWSDGQATCSMPEMGKGEVSLALLAAGAVLGFHADGVPETGPKGSVRESKGVER